LLLLGLVIYATVQVFGGYDFYVYEAEIIGNERVSSELIYAMSGIDKNNIFWIRPGRVRTAIKKLPGIAEAEVSVRPPNRVSIAISERQPLFIWRTSYYSRWLAKDGGPMPEDGSPPTLTLLDSQAMAWSESGRFRQQVFIDVQALHQERPEIRQIHYGPGEGLYFTTPEGWDVYLGEGHVVEKLFLLESMKQELANRTEPPSIVDLRVNGEAYLR
jgi:cell division septal protein FtsQ